jgi:hypothetical protein
MTGFDEILKVLPFLAPLIALELGLMIFALVNLIRRPKVRGSKVLWAIIIVLVQIVGPILYLTIGRKEETDAGDTD